MKKRNLNNYAMALTALSALGRLIPHIPNVTPMGGSSLFAGAKVRSVWAYLIPLAVMAATDPFVGGYTKLSPVIYACFLINVFLGRRLLQEVTAVRVGATAFLCSLQFFLLTNFGIWAMGHFYSHDLAGLVTCYTAAIPFWGRTLMGDLAYSGAIFGVYSVLSRNSAGASEWHLADERGAS